MEHNIEHSSGKDLEQLAAQLVRTMDLLDKSDQRLATLKMAPGETKFRDPVDTYHQITIGAVLARYGLNAHHARLLDGLLSMNLRQLQEFMAEASVVAPSDDGDDDEGSMGSALLELLELMPGRLDEIGRYAEWHRAFDSYMEKTQPFLESMTADDLERLAARPASKKQMHLIRTTCAYHRIAFPTVPNRRAAFEWLRDIGANEKYREVRP